MNSDISRVSCKVSGGSLPEDYSATIPLEIDYSGSSTIQQRAWSNRTLVILVQRGMRTMTVEQLDKLIKTGYKVLATDCGKKVETREQKVARYEALGLPKNIAQMAVDEPTKFQEVMDTLGK